MSDDPHAIDPATKCIADALPTLKAVEMACFDAQCFGEGMALSGIIYLLAQWVDNNTPPSSPEFATAQAILDDCGSNRI